MPEKEWKNGLESEPVTTYVSQETKSVWEEHADNMGLSLSRFVEMMVNSGRSNYAETAPEGYDDPVAVKREKQALEDRLEDLENVPESDDALEVYSCLSEDDYMRVEEVADSVDRDEPVVYESLQALIEEGLVEYDTMKNGYRKK